MIKLTATVPLISWLYSEHPCTCSKQLFIN